MAASTSATPSMISKLENEFALVLKAIIVPLANVPLTQYGTSLNSSEINLARGIAKRMIDSGYSNECFQVYTRAWRSVMDDMLCRIDELENMEIDYMLQLAKTQTAVVRSITERGESLYRLIFESSDYVNGFCSAEVLDRFLMDLISYAKKVAVKETSEDLFHIVNGLSFLPWFKTTVQNGEVHDLTILAMKILKHESNTLEAGVHNEKRMLLLVSSVEDNLKEKFEHCSDSALGHIFLLNNISYMIQKVKDDARDQELLGGDWLPTRQGLVKEHTTSFIEESWSRSVTCLEIGSSSEVSTRLRYFNKSFEELYKAQTGWNITDAQLRDELQEIISSRVVAAYDDFLAMHASTVNNLRHSNLKYSSNELKALLLNLFKGVPLQIHK